ncbi:glucose/galactose transporter [Mucilaginibacter frigoritolerans]|uniref:Glucose/galactose transporter n=1 Tax=Mucilaginibacter frigoritolerans TaxID=652788 RepID=A0A562UCN5_9SPHI|nr:sugar MFS transporter [Mucilaginibacter frigoritolerans]TWJ03614.1 glucose/galactose transporter [Mucilaginibacter frigoritolerans]
MESTAGPTSSVKKSPGLSPIAIIGVLFFIFGFVTWMNGVLIPYLKIACQLNNFEAYFVTFAFYIAYLVMAVPASWVLKIFGFKNGMGVGLLIMAVGALIFIPAALTRTYIFFLAGLFIQGTGLAVLQTASNPYITILGPAESAAKRISIMGICNKVAGAIAPIVLASVALKGIDQISTKLKTMNAVQKAVELDSLASRVILPYVVMVVVLVLLSIFIFVSGLPEINTEHEDETVTAANTNKTSIFHFPHLMLGVIALFLYVGAEVLAGDSIISYGASQHIPLSTAKFFTTCTLISMMVGYVIGILCIPKYITQHKALVISAILGVVLTIAALLTSGYVSVMCIALLGLANSLMWPAIWPLALSNLGRFTKIGSSLLVMGIAGGALIPLLYGRLVDVFSAREAYIILLPIYLFIAYFASMGYKKGHRKTA